MASYNVQLKNGPGDDLYPVVRVVASALPEATSDYLGQHTIYTGPTTNGLKTGHIYRVVETGWNSWGWEDVSTSQFVPDVPIGSGARLLNGPTIPEWVYGENNQELSGGLVEAADGTLYILRLEGGTTTVNFNPGSGARLKDLNFGLRLTQAATTGALVLRGGGRKVRWGDGNMPPQFSEDNPPPAISVGATAYMIRFHWDAIEQALLGNLEYTITVYSELEPIAETRGVYISSGVTPISSGMVINGYTVNGGNTISVYNHGVAAAGRVTATDNASAVACVYSGGLLSECTLSSNPTAGGKPTNLVVSDGGLATIIDVKDNGRIYVNSGGAVTDVQLYIGSMRISAGGLGATVQLNTDRAYTYVESGGVLQNAHLHSGNMTVSSAGVVSGLILEAGAIADVSSGGSAYNIEIREMGTLNASPGCYLENLSMGQQAETNISSGTSAVNVFVGGGAYPYVEDGGIAENVRVDPGAGLSINAGGSASIEYNPFATPEIYADDGAIVTYLERDACVYVASHTTLISKVNIWEGGSLESGSRAIVYSGGVARNTVVLGGGTLTISSGGQAVGVQCTPGIGTITVHDGGAISYAESFNGIYLVSANQLISRGEYMDNITWSNGAIFIYSSGYLAGGENGLLTSCMVYLEGADVSFGGFATVRTTIEVRENAYAGPIIGSSGTLFYFYNCTCDGIKVSAYASACLHSGTNMYDLHVYSAGQVWCSGGYAESVVVDRGAKMHLSSGCYITGLTAGGSGGGWTYVYVSSGSVVNDVILSSGCRFQVHSGASALGVTKLAGATVYSSAGAYIEYA